MQKVILPFSETKRFSSLVDDYLQGSANLKQFYRFSPESSSFKNAIAEKSNSYCNRKLLQQVLLQQYKTLLNTDDAAIDKVKNSINLLSDNNTFTVTTGHQLNIFTGPLFAIYKIATTIKLAKHLNEAYTQNKFVPVFWMASEDHDFDEIKSIRIYGKTFTWEKTSGGPVGEMDTAGLKSILNEIEEIIGKDHSIFDLFKKAYTGTNDLSEATREIVHRIFGKYGLVVIDGNDAKLKSEFSDVMRDELTTQVSFTSMQQSNLEFSKNYKVQVQPREINLFYMEDNLRERIVKNTDGSFSVNNTSINFTESEVLDIVKNHPEKLSPNVVLRPLYQEKILPNLAYIGGPGELNYWLQLKSVFEAHHVLYPVLILRNCMMIIDKSSFTKMNKLGIQLPDLFQSSEYLLLKILENSSQIHLGTDLQAAGVQKLFGDLSASYAQIDASLTPTVESEKQKVLNALKTLEEKARRALKKKNETVVNQVKNLKDKLFPENELQERTDNFIPYLINFEGDFIEEVIEQAEPFPNNFINLIEN